MSGPNPLSSTRALALSVIACCLVTSAHGAPSRIAAPESSELGEEIAAYLLATPNERAAVVHRLMGERSASEVLDAIEARHVSRPKRRRGLHTREVRVGDRVSNYVVVAPRAYDPKKSWPMHISLHGGGKPSRYNERTCWEHDWGRRAPREFILVCPTTPAGKWWLPSGEARVMAVYREVLRDWNIDLDRVSIGGMSNGGTGAWHMAMKYPWLWSGVVPRCAGEIRDDGFVENIAKLPTYMIHGARDHLIPVKASRAMRDRLSRVGNEARLTEIKGGGHRFFSRENRAVVAWLRDRRRDLPHSITYNALPDSDQNPPGLVYWIHAPGAQSIRASLIREPTGVRVNLEGDALPERTTVYIPEALVSPGGGLRVFRGGARVHEGPMVPSIEAVLESYRLSGDPGRTYTVGVTLELNRDPAEAQSEPAPSGSDTQRNP
jgi:pimeloyl-ACP methyl ester carboxylesterase